MNLGAEKSKSGTTWAPISRIPTERQVTRTAPTSCRQGIVFEPKIGRRRADEEVDLHLAVICMGVDAAEGAVVHVCPSLTGAQRRVVSRGYVLFFGFRLRELGLEQKGSGAYEFMRLFCQGLLSREGSELLDRTGIHLFVQSAQSVR